MLPTLTAGSINRILEGEEVAGVTMQILGCKKIPDSRNDRYRLLISDSVTGCPFAVLGMQLNSMVTNKELERYTIFRVDKCVCNQIQADRKVIILLKLVVLVPGAEVGEKIGNPINSTSSAANATGDNNTESKSVCNADNALKCVSAPEVNGSIQTVHPNASLTHNLVHFQTKLPTLTAGSINRILEGEEVAGVTMQILGCKKIPGSDRYRLLISDSVTGCPFAMLGTQLNSMVTNKELERYTIVRVDKCVCNQIQADQKVIILLKLVVLVPGAEVGEKIGNPINSSTSSVANANNAPKI